MKLTNKDKEFLERLHRLLEKKELSVDLVSRGLKQMVLRGNYGDRIDRCFGMTRQGVRWRFQRLFNEVYVSAYETIYFLENLIGPELRGYALEIAKERVALRRKARKTTDPGFYRRGRPVHIARSRALPNCKGICPPLFKAQINS